MNADEKELKMLIKIFIIICEFLKSKHDVQHNIPLVKQIMKEPK